MLISIIVPLYNAAPYIVRLMSCLLNQTYENLEIILYDDASKDNTREMLRDYQKRHPDMVRAGYSDTNGGIGAGKNYGVKNARGDYLMFVDQDDYIDYNYVEHLVACVKENPGTDLVISGFTVVHENGDIIYVRSPKTTDVAFRRNIPLWGKLYLREFVIKNNLWSPLKVILEDVLYQAALAACSPKLSLCGTTNGYYWVRNMKSASKTGLKSFPPHALKNGFTYLISQKKPGSRTVRNDELCYGAFLFVVWHLLKCG